MATAEVVETPRGDDTVVEFRRRVGTKGLEAAGNLTTNSVFLVVRLRKPGNRRKVSASQVEVDADRDAITVGKELLDSPELAAITALDGRMRRHIYARSLPYAVLKDGVYRLPLRLLEEVDSDLQGFREEREGLIEAFLTVYPEKVAGASHRLRALYDPGDYPGVEALRGAFGFQWRYMSFGVPESLSARLLARERQQAAADVAAEVEEIRLALRTSFAEVVSHAAQRLAHNEDGKPRVFRDSLVQNMEDFLAYFHARNLTQDGELAALVEQARAVLRGVTPQDLRDQEGLRREVQQTMASIRETMDQSLMLKPTRRFALAPEEEADSANV